MAPKDGAKPKARIKEARAETDQPEQFLQPSANAAEAGGTAPPQSYSDLPLQAVPKPQLAPTENYDRSRLAKVTEQLTAADVERRVAAAEADKLAAKMEARALSHCFV